MMNIPPRRGRARTNTTSRPRQYSPAVDSLESRQLLTSAAFSVAFGSGSGGTVSIKAVAVDSSGNDYVTGGYNGTVTFGTTTLTSRGVENIFVAKIGLKGNVLWADSMGSAAPADGDYGRGIALDSSGNAYVTGYIAGNAQFGGTTLTDAGGRDIFLTKLNTNGGIVYATNFGGTGDDLGQAIAVDSAGDAVITGSYQNAVTFGGTTLTAADASSTDVFVVKVNPTGSATWATNLAGSGDNSGFGVGIDGPGYIYVTGNFTGSGTFGPVTLNSAGDSDIFVTQLTPTGTVNWADDQGSSGHDDGVALAVDSAGDIYVTGDFVGTAGFGGINLASAGQDDAFVEGLNNAGAVMWADRAGGTSFDAGFGIALDSVGDVYMTGVFQGTGTFGTTTLTSAGGYDIYLAKYGPGGTEIEALQYGSVNTDQAFGVAVGGPKSNVTLVGDYGAKFNVFNDGLGAAGSGYVIQISQVTPSAGSEGLSNFNQLGYSQISIYRPSTHQWYTVTPTTNLPLGTFGQANDIPAAGDYLGLGQSQLAVYRPSTAQWLDSSATSNGGVIGVFGASTDVPVPGDYFGVGHTELAVFRPSTDQWFVAGPKGNVVLGTFGGPGDLPVPGDYFGTGKTEMAVFRPSTDQWFVAGPNGNVLYTTFGGPGDVPAPGDYDALGHAQVAIFRPSNAQWYVQGTGGNRLLNVFGGVNYLDIPTEAPAGSLKLNGAYTGGIGIGGGSGGGFHPSAIGVAGATSGSGSVALAGVGNTAVVPASVVTVTGSTLTSTRSTPVVAYLIPSDVLAHDKVWASAIDGLDD